MYILRNLPIEHYPEQLIDYKPPTREPPESHLHLKALHSKAREPGKHGGPFLHSATFKGTTMEADKECFGRIQPVQDGRGRKNNMCFSLCFCFAGQQMYKTVSNFDGERNSNTKDWVSNKLPQQLGLMPKKLLSCMSPGKLLPGPSKFP